MRKIIPTSALDRATIKDISNIRVIRGVHFNTCTDTETSSKDLASPSGLKASVEKEDVSSLSGDCVAQANTTGQFDTPVYKSIKYDLYNNSDITDNKPKYNLSVSTLDPKMSYKVRLNSEYQFFKRGVEDLLDEDHYHNMLELYQQLNNGTSDILRIAKAYKNKGTRQKPQMETVIYQSVILQKTFNNEYHIYHADEHRIYHCQLKTRNDIQFTQSQLNTPLFATGWISRGRTLNKTRLTAKDIIEQGQDL